MNFAVFLGKLKKYYLKKLVIFFMLIMSGCSNSKNYYNSGSGNVGGLCRSCSPYKIKGWWYYPQKHYSYDKEGIASWYGPGFHRKLKAQGQKFNMHAISAAHKTLPLPSVVSVENLSNGKSLKLVIDDRGPYVGDRIIDLSVGAAKKLGMYRNGLCKVRVKVIPNESRLLSNYLRKVGGRKGHDPKGRSWQQVYEQEIKGRKIVKARNKKIRNIKKKVVRSKSIVQKFQYYVKLGAFLHKKNAQAFKDELLGVANSNLKEGSLSSGQKVYIVSAGPYNSSLKAKNAQLFFRKAGYDKTKVVCVDGK